jgi:cell wall-associated NlpC family hydrolase
MTFDPRITPARPDLAALHLKGRVEAARFVEASLREVIDPHAPVRRSPAPDAPLDTEALRGELVSIYEEDGEGWCWGQLCADGYVGFMPANALRAPGPAATHRVAALRTLVFPARSIKAPPVDALSFGARVAVARGPGDATGVDEGSDGLTRLASGFYVPARHLAPIEDTERDFVADAERFVGVPYLWGGKTSLGIDCSGLVQVALTASGIACPRDSDMQEAALGTPLPAAGAEPAPMAAARPVGAAARTDLRRGDLVFWKGHVAIMREPDTIIHANAFHMAVAVELLADAIRRSAAVGRAITSIRRLG